jgi:mannose-6-phosphate isomerase-like protein (cupin superfamily)
LSRRFIATIALCVLAACASAPAELPASPEFVVENVAERQVQVLPEGLLYWRVETFPSLDRAQAAAGPTSLAADVSGRSWLVTLGPRGAASMGGTHVAEIGPIPRVLARRYTIRLNHAHAPPGAATSVHSHPGSEAFYVISGQLTQRRRGGVERVNAGENMNGRVSNTIMQLQSTGTENLDQLVLFLVDADRPFSSPESFHH